MVQDVNPYEAPKAQQQERIPVDAQLRRPPAGKVVLLVVLQMAANALFGLATRTMHLNVSLPGGAPVVGMLVGALVFAAREKRNRAKPWGRDYPTFLALQSTLVWSIMTGASMIILRRMVHSHQEMDNVHWGIVIVRLLVLNFFGTRLGLALGGWAMRNRGWPHTPVS